jgi:hypothetical protein
VFLSERLIDTRGGGEGAFYIFPLPKLNITYSNQPGQQIGYSSDILLTHMAMGPRLRQGDVPLRTFRCGITVPPATLHGTTEGLSTALPPSSPDPALPLQDNRTGQVQDISAGRTRPSTHENGATTAPAAAQPEPEIWNWMQRVGCVLGILGTFVAIIYFVFPYRAAITANQLATNGIALANVANGWTRWTQCTAPGSVSIQITTYVRIDLLKRMMR